MAQRNIRETLKTILTTDMTGGTQGGLMLPEQTDRFLDLTLEYSRMLQMIRVEPKTNRQGEIDTLNVGSVVTEGAGEEPDDGTSPDEEVKPTFGKLEYTVAKLRSMFNISTESLLDNIEAEQRLITQHGGQKGEAPATDFRDTLMRAYAKRIATDLELLAIQGDSSLDTSTKTNRLLRSNQGWDILSDTGTHLVDAGNLNVSEQLFFDMLEALPAPYLKRINELRWFVGPRTWIRWMRRIATRATALGDKSVEGEAARPLGIDMVMIPLIPEDKENVVGTTTYDNESFIWLTFPENFIYIPRRQVEVYWDFIPRRDRWENTTYSETDMLIEQPDALVKATNVKVDATTDYS